MKKKVILVLVVVLAIAFVFPCFSEGLLPELGDVFGVEMPSPCEFFGRYPDNLVELSDGCVEETFNSISEEQYTAYGETLGASGCEIIESSVDGTLFNATIQKQGKNFRFSYDTANQIVTITYMSGAYDPVIKDSEEAYQNAVTLMDEGKYEEASQILKDISGYKDAETLINEANAGSIETVYQQAIVLLEGGQFEEAYDAFTGIADYKDSQYLLDYDDNLAMIGLDRRWPVGSVLALGSYNDAPLYWEILEKDGTKALICTDDYVDKIYYNNNDEAATNWSKCSLRSWLNGKFYKDSFTKDEKSIIYETKLDNPDSAEVSGGPDTTDRVFISDTSISGHDGWAWIRKPGRRKNLTMTENGHGGNAKTKNPVYPMMWIDLVKYDSWTYTKVDPDQYSSNVQSSDEPIGSDITLQIGSKGADVEKLQRTLINMGYLSGNADGIFGNMTATAVKAAQEALGLEQTGIANAELLEKLYN